ncbi:hypothetical protein SLA2020_111430 [Shorea laevis]
MIAKGWYTDRIGSPTFCLVAKLHHCKQQLQTWSKMTSRRTHQEIADLQKELDTLQAEELSDRNTSRQKILLDDINSLWQQEEAYWFQ